MNAKNPLEKNNLNWLGFINLLVVYIVWGSTYLAIRVTVKDDGGFPPFIMGLTRVAAGGSLLLLWGALRKYRLKPKREEFISLIITAVFVNYYSQSKRLAGLTILAALIAVGWQLGLLNLLGYGIDPMSILVPFLVLAIGVSHGVQMVRSFREAFFAGRTSRDAARESFVQLLIPGSTALVTDLIGFITILIIRIPIIRLTMSIHRYTCSSQHCANMCSGKSFSANGLFLLSQHS